MLLSEEDVIHTLQKWAFQGGGRGGKKKGGDSQLFGGMDARRIS